MKLPKKLIIAQFFLQRGSIEDVYSLSMEAILQKKNKNIQLENLCGSLSRL